ncbi:ABC transport system, permease component YbhR [Rhodovastum atsumiense]|uniref:ABC transporter permease n=1 Tax=Rhodovastum atsumiense TaxID=504468 RepID=A0A5M6ILQ1_9PROT|nr:ABC transporter permease [Rhodovastum atsumiense]KAA5609112.1 ABC transporter permease [Rhodovastum atsumiense]CAH2603788.1 ABC transport system, permease component YbhR [Rhodovastum atsumiense]
MWRRVLALVLKELASLWKDPKTRAVLLGPPLVQVLIFSYAATFEVQKVPLAVWNEDAGVQAAELVRRFAASPAFRVVAAPQDPASARADLDARDVVAVLHVPQDFSARVLGGREARVQLLLDARRSNTALLVNGYAGAIVQRFALEHQSVPVLPIALEVRDWFNPTLDPQWFILPGLVAVLSLLMAMLVSSLSLARERELGTFEQLLVTPLRPVEIMLGKAVPAAIVGLVEAHIVIAAALLWFRLPFTGSVLLLEVALLVYMLAGVGVGLAISSVARTQQQAILGVFIYASPAVVLSGFAAPVENMPVVVEWLSRADPIRWMLVVARGVFLQDMPAAVAVQAIWPMALIAVVLLGVATVSVRRALG